MRIMLAYQMGFIVCVGAAHRVFIIAAAATCTFACVVKSEMNTQILRLFPMIYARTTRGVNAAAAIAQNTQPEPIRLCGAAELQWPSVLKNEVYVLLVAIAATQFAIRLLVSLMCAMCDVCTCHSFVCEL